MVNPQSGVRGSDNWGNCVQIGIIRVETVAFGEYEKSRDTPYTGSGPDGMRRDVNGLIMNYQNDLDITNYIIFPV